MRTTIKCTLLSCLVFFSFLLSGQVNSDTLKTKNLVSLSFAHLINAQNTIGILISIKRSPSPSTLTENTHKGIKQITISSITTSEINHLEPFVSLLSYYAKKTMIADKLDVKEIKNTLMQFASITTSNIIKYLKINTSAASRRSIKSENI